MGPDKAWMIAVKKSMITSFLAKGMYRIITEYAKVILINNSVKLTN